MTNGKNSSWLQRSLNTAKIAFQRSFRPDRPGVQYSVLPSNQSFWVWCVVAVILTVVSFVWLDVIFYEIQNARRNDFGFEINFYRKLTRLGETKWTVLVTVVIALPLSTLDWSRFTRKRRLFLINIYSDMNFLFSTTVIPGILAFLMKNFIGRARPKLYPEFGPHYFDMFSFERNLASFPSGHSTTFGATCMALTLLFPRWWWLWLVTAIVGGITRIMMLSHYPSDAIAGLAFGAGFALLTARWLARKGVMFKINGNVLPVRKR